MKFRLRALKMGAATLTMMAAAAVQAPTSVADSTNSGVDRPGHVAAQCELTPWTQYGSYITDETSPWFNSVPGIDFTRQIQFRVSGGIYAERTTDACLVQKAKFAGASQYRETQCAQPGACRVTPWLYYGGNVEPTGFRFPNRNAGYDPHAHIFNTWEMSGPGPWDQP